MQGLFGAKKRFILLALGFVLAPACSPASKNPLSAPETAVADERLCGAWKPVCEKEKWDGCSLAFIGKCNQPDKPAGMMKLLVVDCDRNKGLKVGEPFLFFVTSLGGRHYQNWMEDSHPTHDGKQVPGHREAAPYTLVKYELNGDRLTLWLADHDGAEKAIDQGKLKGTIEENKYMNSCVRSSNAPITLTASTEELRQFLLDGGDAMLFTTGFQMTFERVK